jgi:hypothetical protein
MPGVGRTHISRGLYNVRLHPFGSPDSFSQRHDRLLSWETLSADQQCPDESQCKLIPHKSLDALMMLAVAG